MALEDAALEGLAPTACDGAVGPGDVACETFESGHGAVVDVAALGGSLGLGATMLAEPLAVAVAGFAAAGVLAVAAGVEPEPLVLLERPYRTKNHTPASRHTPTSAI